MQWKKTPPALAAVFDKAAPKDPRVVRKPMFGYPALFLNGKPMGEHPVDKYDMLTVELPYEPGNLGDFPPSTRDLPSPNRKRFNPGFGDTDALRRSWPPGQIGAGAKVPG